MRGRGVAVTGPSVELVVGRYRPDRDGVSGYVERLVDALPSVGVRASVTEWPGVRRFRPRPDADLVHVQFAPSAYGYSGGIGLAPVLVGRRPLITTLHEYGWWTWTPVELPGPLAHLPGAVARVAERTGRWDRETLLLAPGSARLVVTGRGHAGVVRARLGRDAVAIPIGANVGVAYRGDRAAARRELALPLDLPLVVFFGFVHPVKGLRYLIDAFAELRRNGHPDLRAVVVGGWRSLAWPDDEADAFVEELRAHARTAGLSEETFTFAGFLDEVEASRWLRAADLAALPFTHGITAKSGSLLTCWAHDLPTVATEPPDGADPDVVGAVLPATPRDVPTVRDALARLLDDPAERQRLAVTGRERMAARSWEAVAAAHAELYRQVLA